MATKEKKSVTDPAEKEQAAEPQGLWQKLNAFGEKHAKVIIFASSLLIILTVVIFAKVFYDRTLAERAAREVSQAETIDKLKELKEKYKDAPVAAEIVYRLANRYYEEQKLAEAKKEFEEFKSRFPNHPLKFFVDKAYTTLIANQKFLEEDKERRVKVRTLQSHPEERKDLREWIAKLSEDQRKSVDTSTLFYGPVHEPPTEIGLQIEGKEKIWIQLYDDDTPNTVANLRKLVEDKAFDGAKIEKNGDTYKISAKVDFVLEFEASDRKPELMDDIVVVVRKIAGKEQVPGAEIELLPGTADLKDCTIVGKVTQQWPVVQSLAGTETVKTFTVEKGRSGKIEPKRIKPE